MGAPLLSVSALCKRYAVPVLDGVEFAVEPGEVHALVGANGAGKSTLCRIVCGLTPFDSGVMQVAGEAYKPVSVLDAESRGIRIVMQEPHLIDTLSIGENLFFADLPTRRGLVDFERLFDESRDALGRMGLDTLDPRQPVGRLGIGQRQLIEIARVLRHSVKLLILDEPTAALTDPQIDLLFEKIGELTAAGTGVIYVSHRIAEFRRIADRLTVLRNGQASDAHSVDELDDAEIVRLMAGRKTAQGIERPPAERRLAVRLRGFCSANRFSDVNLDIRYGEILGIGGLVGSGRTELLRAVFGADPIDAGHVILDDGKRRVFASPVDATEYGIGMIPEDRGREAVLPGQSIARNMSLASQRNFGGPGGWLDLDAEAAAVDAQREQLDIDCTGMDQPVEELSGGNQQKVIIARWLMKDCRVLLFDEPTRGIDIQTRQAIYELLAELAAAGKAVVVVSSENRELTTICDRIVVLSGGSVAAEFRRGEWSAEKLMAAAFSAYTDDAA